MDTIEARESGAGAQKAWQPTEPLFQDDETADVILRSKDGINFRVHRLILSLASPLFRDMFAIGAASRQENSLATEEKDAASGLPIVPIMEETGETVEKLLQLCYPGPLEAPIWKSASQLQPVLAAAMKYQFEGAANVLRKELVSLKLLKREPLQVFAAASSLRLQEEARIAARRLLSVEIEIIPEFDELRFVSGLVMFRWMAYRKRCRAAAQSLTLSPGLEWDTKRDWIWVTCSNSQCHRYHDDHYQGLAASWWGGYMLNIRGLLGGYPSGEIVTRESSRKPSSLSLSGCTTCSLQASWDITWFSDLLGKEVDKTTKEIAETYDFCG